MNLSNLKKNLEQEIVKGLMETFGVDASCNCDVNGTYYISMIYAEPPKKDGEALYHCYTVEYYENGNELQISGVNRLVLNDNFGVCAIKDTAIMMSTSFINDVDAIIKRSIAKATNPAAAEEAEAEAEPHHS